MNVPIKPPKNNPKNTDSSVSHINNLIKAYAIVKIANNNTVIVGV